MRYSRRDPRGAALVAASLAALILPSEALAKEPVKHGPVRRTYDFTRPRPDEILPNPTTGVGTPPRLRAYVTAKDMATSGTTADKDTDSAAKPDAGRGTKGAADTAADASPSATTAAPDAAPSAPSAATAPPPDAEAWRSSVTTQVSRHVESTLAKQVVSRGLDGHFAYQPSVAARNDPKIEALEKRNWDHVVASLDTSWRAWQAAHPAAGDSGVARQVARKTTADRNDPGSISPAPTAPGEIDLKDAPARVTGDLPAGE